MTTASTARAAADALAAVAHAEAPEAAAWRPKLAAALSALGAAGDTGAAAAAERLQRCVLHAGCIVVALRFVVSKNLEQRASWQLMREGMDS